MVRSWIHQFVVRPAFLREYSGGGRSAARLERVLAVGRAFLTVTALIAIYLDPSLPTRMTTPTYVVLVGYAIYSVGVLAMVHYAGRVAPVHGAVLHAGDILWASLLTFVSEGPISPFFLFFLFAVLAAAYRWGFRETMATAIVTVSIFLVETAVAAAGPWNTTWFHAIDFDLNATILRVAYLLLTGFLLGYLAEQDKQARGELAAIAAAALQPRVDAGLRSSVAAVAANLLQMFHADGVALVVEAHDTRQTLLWHVHRSGPEAPAGEDAAPSAASSLELDAARRDAWLFPGPGQAWHVIRSAADEWQWRVTQPGAWRLARGRGDLPDAIKDAGAFSTVTAVDLGLADEWSGRIYLFNMSAGGSLERRVHFLEDLTDHITPGLTNVLLLRRLRSQAGATERARVARELHDGAIQSLIGIEMKVETMRRRATGGADSTRELAEIQSLLRQEVLALRELMQTIRPIELDSGDQLADVLAGVVERFRRDTSIPARFVATGGPIELHRATALELVRIVQEALVNVRKHSRASNVLVRLSRQPDACALVVEDDGGGFEFDGQLTAAELDRRRLGPAIIKERARTIGAALTVESWPGTGARIALTFAEEPRG